MKIPEMNNTNFIWKKYISNSLDNLNSKIYLPAVWDVSVTTLNICCKMSVKYVW